MVRLDEKALNQIFETLSDWEHILQAEKTDLEALAISGASETEVKHEDKPATKSAKRTCRKQVRS